MKKNDTEPLFYLYGKHVCSLQWVMIGQFNYDDAQDFMDNTQYSEFYPDGEYLGFWLTMKKIDL